MDPGYQLLWEACEYIPPPPLPPRHPLLDRFGFVWVTDLGLYLDSRQGIIQNVSIIKPGNNRFNDGPLLWIFFHCYILKHMQCNGAMEVSGTSIRWALIWSGQRLVPVQTQHFAVCLICDKRRRQLRSEASGKIMKRKCVKRAGDPAVWPVLDGNFTLKRNEAMRTKNRTES